MFENNERSVCLFVCLSVCLSVALLRPANTAKLIEVLFEMETQIYTLDL